MKTEEYKEEEMKARIIAVDTGNHSIKTPNIVFRASVNPDDSTGLGRDKLIYQGKEYSVGIGEPVNYSQTKMNDDYLLLTMAAIAQEFIFMANKNGSSLGDVVKATIILAMGLPPRDKNRMEKEYEDFFCRPYDFTYAGIHFKLNTQKVFVFYQCLAAAAGVCNKLEKRFGTGDMIFIDIGGYTIDCMLRDSNDEWSPGKSYNAGSLYLYETVKDALYDVAYVRPTDSFLDQYFLKTPKEELAKNKYHEVYQAACAKFVQKCMNIIDRQYDITNKFPVFLGGGSALYQPFIEEWFEQNAHFCDPQFITKQTANADGYKKMATAKLKMGK